MGKLNQVIAVVPGKKALAEKVLTEAYHKFQKPDAMKGLSKKYRPKDDEGDMLPPDEKLVEYSVTDIIKEVKPCLEDMLNIVSTQDNGNLQASADIVVEMPDAKHTIVANVPVTTLLFLEKQLTNLKTFVSKIPTLEPGERWDYDENVGCYSAGPSVTTKSKKVPQRLVKYEATPEHPAQVDVYNEDVVIGYWDTMKYSGAIPAQQKSEMLDRVRKLHEAVLRAREAANAIDITDVKIGKPILDFVFESKA